MGVGWGRRGGGGAGRCRSSGSGNFVLHLVCWSLQKQNCSFATEVVGLVSLSNLLDVEKRLLHSMCQDFQFGDEVSYAVVLISFSMPATLDCLQQACRSAPK